MNIVFLSHASLGTGFVVGSHQLAKALVLDGHNVYHISSPVSLLHFVLGKERRLKFFYALKNRSKINNSFRFIDFIPICITPMGYCNLLDRINHWFIDYQIKKHIRSSNIDLVLLDQPLLYRSLNIFSTATKVYRPTDLYSEMGGDKFAQPEKKAIAKSHGIVATSTQVYDHIQTITNKPGLTVQNGVDYDLFDQITDEKKQDKCIYVGAVDFRFDLETAIILAQNNSDIEFDYYGPISISLDSNLPQNLHFYGAIDYQKIPKLLTKYKYSVIPMNSHKANDGRSPMKLYEFLAAGLPVLSRKTRSIQYEIPPGVWLYDNNKFVQSKFTEMERSVRNYPIGDFKAIAKKESWSIKAQQILDFTKTLMRAE